MIDSPEIISRKDALAAGLKRYFTGKPCKRGHVVEYYVLSRDCIECAKLRARKNHRCDPERDRKRQNAIDACETARKKGLKRFFTGKPCKHGHVTERMVSNKQCLECAKLNARKKSGFDSERYLKRKEACAVREAARKKGLKWFFTGEPCKYGHVKERCVSSGGCIECAKLRSCKKRGIDPERYRKRQEYRAARKAAHEKGLKRFFTGEPCKNGHVVELSVSSGGCIECQSERVRKDRANNPEKYKEYGRKAYADDPEKGRKRSLDYANANREKVRKSKRDRYAADPEKFLKASREYRTANLEYCRKQNRDWGKKDRANNPTKYLERERKFRKENRELWREWGRTWAKANPDKKKKHNATYYLKHKDKMNVASRKSYIANSKERNKQGRARYVANKEEILKQQRQARIDNPEKYSAAAKKRRYSKLGRLKAFWGMIKSRMGLRRGARKKLLTYDADVFQAHLVNTLPGKMTYQEACKAGYQHDHIVPISYISKNFPFDIACKMVVDLDNIRFIPATENMQKHSKMGDPYQLQVLDILKERYL